MGFDSKHPLTPAPPITPATLQPQLGQGGRADAKRRVLAATASGGTLQAFYSLAKDFLAAVAFYRLAKDFPLRHSSGGTKAF